MTVRELIAELQDLPDGAMDQEVKIDGDIESMRDIDGVLSSPNEKAAYICPRGKR